MIRAACTVNVGDNVWASPMHGWRQVVGVFIGHRAVVLDFADGNSQRFNTWDEISVFDA